MIYRSSRIHSDIELETGPRSWSREERDETMMHHELSLNPRLSPSPSLTNPGFPPLSTLFHDAASGSSGLDGRHSLVIPVVN